MSTFRLDSFRALDPVEPLDWLESVESAATPGPWGKDGMGLLSSAVYKNTDGYFTADMIIHDEGGIGDKDIAFIAVARDAMPALIREVRRLQLVIQAMERDGYPSTSAVALANRILLVKDAYHEGYSHSCFAEPRWEQSESKRVLLDGCP